MRKADKFSKPKQLCSWKEEMDVMAYHIKQKALRNGRLNILEAGCGTMWGLDLKGIEYTLTGVDIDKNALDMRKNEQKDLDIGILGDLSIVILEEKKYDVIYNSYVLEHIKGAERVMENFVRWLKPGGLLILRVPNRESVRGFLTIITPLWFHTFYLRYFEGHNNTGQPGHAPFPTFYDKIISRNGIYEFCKKHGLITRAEYYGGIGRKGRKFFSLLSKLTAWVLHLASFRRLSIKHVTLIYIIEKP